MIKSYFFVPASNPRFIEKSYQLEEVDFWIFDFEGSISPSDIEQAILNVNSYLSAYPIGYGFR